ncbi:MAG: hypothetical protein EU548_10265 [Promethearchaeota archaeon]|nr:MAG: hypothetical protein EU548_10265 [Candidatus Lokiarchaeota archaeon]
MSTVEEARKIKAKYEQELLSKAGVVGCSIGYKKIGGKKTNNLSIVCYVKKKKKEEELKENDIIPEKIEGIPTDVVETGKLRTV